MCGIAGIVAPKGFDPDVLVKMTHLIRYRGPDGFGFAFVSPENRLPEVFHNRDQHPTHHNPVVGLGSRRLAILDVSSAGSQPMQSADGQHTITFNGEIYNYKELRQELRDLGHIFRTQTDTEVILNAYRQWGPACLDRFNGMWAFALWDHRAQKLFCARDRFGVKPFYYASHRGAFFFGSEIKQILQAAHIPRIANSRTCFYFLEWGILDHSSDTFFNGISQLQAGHSLTLHAHRPNDPLIQRYWALSAAPELRLTDDDAVDQFNALFDSAVRLRLRSDVPVGVALSGGLDSSSVLCKAQQIAPTNRFQTFSACFHEPELDESEYISAAISAVNGVGHPTFPQAGRFWQSLNTLIYHHDEPVGSTAAFAQWCVMAEARRHQIPVILGGQGADESLCGYRKYHFFYLWHLFCTANPTFFRELLTRNRQGNSAHGKIAAAARYFPALFHSPFSVTSRLCTSDFRRSFRSAQPGLGSAHNLAERQKIDLTYSSIPGLLHHEDRSSMAHSIESRLPFLDYRLVEFSLRCAPQLKLRDGWSKWLLRNALVGTLPDKIRLRTTKLGFNTPESTWLRMGLLNGHRGMCQVPHLRMERFIDPPKFTAACQRFVRGDAALSASSLFRVVSLESWAQIYAVS